MVLWALDALQALGGRALEPNGSEMKAKKKEEILFHHRRSIMYSKENCAHYSISYHSQYIILFFALTPKASNSPC